MAVKTGGRPPQVAGYGNPFRSIRDLTPERIDMGVDYAGSGPVYALGPGRITAANFSWAGGVGAVGPGAWLVTELTAGPLRGHSVYISENIDMAAQVGDIVDANTIICTITGEGAGIETGFAQDGQPGLYGNTLAMSLGQQAPGHDPGAWSSAAGAAYSAILAKLGCVPGIMSAGGPHGHNPDWLNAITPEIVGQAEATQLLGPLLGDSAALTRVARQLALDAQDMVSQAHAMTSIGRSGWRP